MILDNRLQAGGAKRQRFPQFKKKIKAADGSANQGNQFFSQREAFNSDSIQPDDIGGAAYDPATSEEDEVVDCYEFYCKEKYKLYNLFINRYEMLLIIFLGPSKYLLGLYQMDSSS